MNGAIRNKGKRIIAAFCVCLMLSAYSVSAAEPEFSVQYSQEEANYVIKGQANEAHSRVALLVEKAGQGLVYIDGQDDVSGEYSFTLKPAEYIVSGADYSFTVNVNGSQSAQGKLTQKLNDFQIHSYTLGEDGKTATATVKNLARGAKQAPVLIIACYGPQDGELREVQISEAQQVGGDDLKTYSVSLKNDPAGGTVKAFLWDSLSGMQPLMQTVTKN